MKFEKVGKFSADVITALKLEIPVGTDILLSEYTLQHIKTDHPEITGDHKAIMTDIITAPSGVSFRKKDGTIGFYKEYETGKHYFIELPVRSSSKDEFFVRTLHIIKTKRLNWYVKKGKIIMLDEFNFL